jgi:PRTase ComF-like
MQMYKTFSLYQVNDADNIPFDPAQYSRLKFGDGRAARFYGREMALRFIEEYESLLLSDKEIVLVPSPYCAIPTASYSMTRYFKEEINWFLYVHGKQSMLSSKIHRYKTYSEDYGNLSYEERVNLIASDTYHLDAGFLANRVVLLIDDIKITGSHEYTIRKLVDQAGITGEFIFLYFAELTNPAIPANFENYLNYYEVKNLATLQPIISDNSFIFNTRVIKYILHSRDTVGFAAFLNETSTEKLNGLVQYAISNNYHLMDEYKDNLLQIIKYKKHGN